MKIYSLITMIFFSLCIAAFSACNAEPETESQDSEPPKADTNKNDSGADNTDKAFVGISKDEAEKLAKSRGLLFRVVKEDGKYLPITKDLRANRISATVENGKIVSTKRQ